MRGAGAGGHNQRRFAARDSRLAWSEGLKDQNHRAKSYQNPYCDDRDHGQREYKSTQKTTQARPAFS